MSNQLIQQLKKYIALKDQQSVIYLIDGESTQKISQISQQLSLPQRQYIQTMIESTKKGKQNQVRVNIGQIHNQLLQQKYQSSSDEEGCHLQKIQLQFKIKNIAFRRYFNYPYLDLIQKMVLIYIPRHCQIIFPQLSLKMLHSSIQTLFQYIFTEQVKQTLLQKNKHLGKGVKQYFSFIFKEQYKKYIAFTHIYKTIKSSLQKNKHDNQSIQKLNQMSISTVGSTSEQLQFFQKLTQDFNENQFRQHTKLKSLNFLYFGEKHLYQLSNQFLPPSGSKDTYQLLSFVLCRFIRNVCFTAIKKVGDGKLTPLTHEKTISSLDIKIICNQIIQIYSKRSAQFIKNQESQQETAKRIFLSQFYQYDYQSFIPKNIIQQCFKQLQTKQRTNQSMELSQCVWNRQKNYRILWTQRITAQLYVKGYAKGKNHQYSKFIEKNMEEFQIDNGKMWKKYITLNFDKQIIQKENDQLAKRQPTKKVKLQSLTN